MFRSINSRRLLLVLVLGCFCLALGVQAADNPAEKDKAAAKNTKEEKAAPPATETVKRGPIRIAVELDGVFEGGQAEEISVAPKEWNMLVVQQAAAHGAVVRKGDVLLQLETDKLDRTIAETRNELALSEKAIVQAELQLQAMEKIAPLDMEAGRLAAQFAEEDQAFYFDVLKALSVRVAEQRLKSARDNLEYQEEEFRQLEKMYKADDITEETEEIVLRRARNSLEQAKFMAEIAKVVYDSTLKFELPRKDLEVRESTQRAVLGWERNKLAQPVALDKQRLELDRLRLQRKQAEERLARLEADRLLLTVRAGIDGVVYYGKLNRGRPADAEALADALSPQGKIAPNQVVMTVVAPRPLRVRATVAEAMLNDLRPGLNATAVPTGYPDLELPAALDRIGDVPIAPGQFDGSFTLSLKERIKQLMPGMTCKLKLVPYFKADALRVPTKTLVPDELDEEKFSVKVLKDDGTQVDRPVKLGRKTEKYVEILEGLSEGEKVVLEPAK
jgi:HlyD family secretion protein